MYRLHRISPGREIARDPLPDVLGLAKHGIQIRRGQVSMLAAQPNDGKSFLALWMAVKWAGLGVRTLYLSADTDEHTMLRRAAAAVSGHPQSYIEHSMGADMREGWSEIERALADLNGGVAFSFETDPTYQDIHDELVAFWELWGTYPDALIVDNLMDVVGDNEDEFGSMRDTSKALKRFARTTGAATIPLHHCTEQEKREDHPPSRREITGKVSQKAELILTGQLVDGSGEMRLAPVKNRNGVKDPSGQLFYTFKVDLDRCQIYDRNYRPLGE